MIVNYGLFALLALGLLATLTLSVAPRSGEGNVAVVFPPWTSGGAAVERATATGGALVRTSGLSFVVIVRPVDGGPPLAAARLGAWFLIDASGIPGCAPKSERRA